MNKIKNFDFRWKEPLGKPECPYLYRWVLVLFGYSIRVHRWIRSDDKRYFHDHPWPFITVVLKGDYTDVSPSSGGYAGRNGYFTLHNKEIVLKENLSFGTIKYRKSNHKHYVEVPKNGCWTLLFCGRPNRKWGFWIKGKQFFRPLRYFSKFGHPPCSEQ